MISETRRRLKEWGTWACDDNPGMSSMFKSIFGVRGAQDLRHMPAHIQEIDLIIIQAPKDIRGTLIKFYSIRGTFIDKAISFGLDKLSLRRRIERAEYYVNQALDFPRENAKVRERGLTDHRNKRIAQIAHA